MRSGANKVCSVELLNQKLFLGWLELSFIVIFGIFLVRFSEIAQPNESFDEEDLNYISCFVSTAELTDIE